MSRSSDAASPVRAPTVAPEWFRRAIGIRPSLGSTTVGGARIAYRAWGRPGRRGVVLIHGGAALSSWWDHVGPMLASEYRVAALDLSGHGDSDRRDAYAVELWAQEALAVAHAARIDSVPVLVGHSMGGWVALSAAAWHGHRLAGVIVVDAAVREPSPEETAAAQRRAFGPLRVYESPTAALARFRTIPDHGGSLPYIVDHIARSSLRRVEGGWTWKFDPRIFGRPRPSPQLLTAVSCRVAIVRAERGLVTEDVGAQMYELLGRVAPVIAIPEAGHHVMLDQPLSLVTAIRALLADWEHSTPVTRGSSAGEHGAPSPGGGPEPVADQETS